MNPTTEQLDYRVWASFDGRIFYPVSKPFPCEEEAAQWASGLNAADFYIEPEEN